MERKNLKLSVELHKQFKIQSAQSGMTMVEYLEYLLNKDKKEIINE